MGFVFVLKSRLSYSEKLYMKVAKTAKKTSPKTKIPNARAVDPLYVIFEQHLFNFADPDSDRKTFISQVVSEYISYLRKNNIIVPKSLEQPIVEELGTQVNTMLVRKIYGCLTVSQFDAPKKRVKPRVSKTG